MALSKLVFKPGLNRDQTNYASEGGWYDCDKIRFRSGFPEKIGGWIVQTLTPYVGAARGIYTWITSDGAQLTALGTNEKIYIVVGTNIIDITPIRDSFTSPATNNCFACVDGSPILTITVTGNGVGVGDYVTFSGVTSFADIPTAYLNREFKVLSVDTPLSKFTVSIRQDQTGTYTQSGTTITVTSTAHGLATGQKVYFDATSGSATDAAYSVTVTDSDHFTLTSATSATTSGSCVFYIVAAGTSSSAGGTGITLEAQITIGNDNVTAGYGWGAGTWGRGTWGSSTTTPIYQPARLIQFQNFGDNLIFNIAKGDIFFWEYTPALDTRAIYMKDMPGAVAVPEQVTKILFASTGHLFALGCTNYDALAPAPEYLGGYDPLLVRWSNVDADAGPLPEEWKPELTNTAGFFRLQAGSEIVTAINTRQETLVFTNTSLYSVQYLGTSEVFGQQPMTAHISIIGPNVVTGANNVTYWMGNDKFYTYSGRVDTLPCTLRQYVFNDINRTQGMIFFAGTNAQFNEIIWFYCSQNASQIDRYVVYNYAENIWYFGTIARTCWIDAGNTKYPLAAQSGWVYQHENGHDDGQPLGAPPLGMVSYIQSADIDIGDGEQFMLTKRIIPDVNFNSSLSTNPVTGEPLTTEAYMTVGVRNFPGAANSTTNASGVSNLRDVVTTATIDQYTNQVFVRCRGRQMNFKISSDGVGVQWQLGMPRVDARPDGRRG